MAAFEVLAYLVIVAAGSLAFLAGWLTVNGAVDLTALLLGSLIVLSWIHLGPSVIGPKPIGRLLFPVAQDLKEADDRFNPAIEVRNMELLVGRVQIVVG